MFFNKELFVNEELKAKCKRLEKLQTILIFSILFVFIAAFCACTIPLSIKYEDNFFMGYAMAIFATLSFVCVFAVSVPIISALNKLRKDQTEELKGQPSYDKYAKVLQAGIKLFKVNNLISLSIVVAGIAVMWIIAVIFPYEAYASFPLALFGLISSLVVLIRNRKAGEIKAMEEEIAGGLRRLRND